METAISDNTRLGAYGTNTGPVSFADNLTDAKRLLAISVKWGVRVDSIKCVWEVADAVAKNQESNGKRNGGGGGDHEDIFILEPDEIINKVEVRHGEVIDCLTFFTDKGRQFGPYGNEYGGDLTEVSIASGLRGFFGSNGNVINTIGFFC